MIDHRNRIALWVAREVIPHEAAARKWLARRWGHAVDVDDVIQEAYCRLSALSSVAHISSAKAYLFRTVHNAAVDALRHANVANFAAMTEVEWSNVIDDEPTADRIAEANQEVERVKALLSELSPMCRQVIELRRIEGLSQKETALRLNISENVVENHIARGLRRMIQMSMRQDEDVLEKKAGLIGKP